MKIRVNGVDYDSWDDVPEHEREILRRVMPDQDHNGVPDPVEGRVHPRHATYRATFVATERTRTTRVLHQGTRPGFSFDITDTSVRQVPPEPGEVAAAESLAAPRSDVPILLNGVPVGDDGRPLVRKRWWRRG